MAKPININPGVRAFESQLERWNIDEVRAKELGLEPITDENKMYVPRAAKGHVQVGIKIPYYDYDGQPYDGDPSVSHNDGHLCRYRYVFKDMPFGANPPDCKYAQEEGTRPAVYIPPTDEWNWRQEIAQSADDEHLRTILITEGELKAAMAVQYGFMCLALGGVWTFRSVRWGIKFLPQLEEIYWKKREVIIIYDSDVSQKKDVAAAMNALAEELNSRGARVLMAVLPNQIVDSEGSVLDKVGLDDFIAHSGPEAFAELLDEALPLNSVEQLFEMNDQYCYVAAMNCIYDTKNDRLIPPMAVTNNFARIDYQHQQYIGDGAFKVKKMNIGREWLDWPLCNYALDLTYDPAGEQYSEKDDERYVNIWSGWGCEPKKGNMKPFLELVDFVMTNAEPDAKKWFIQWLAYPIQHPGAKLAQAVVVHGPQGSGKTLLGQLIGKLYGNNYTLIEQYHLQNEFNGWMHGKQFVVGDEISGTGSAEHRRTADKLKHYITGRHITINRKNKEPYDLPNCCNFFFTTNHTDAFHLEGDDRRYFIVKLPPRKEVEFYYKTVKWASDGGAEALFDYLLNVDLKGFEPGGLAPYTQHKQEMRREGLSSLGSWLHDTLFDGPVMFGGIEIKSDLWTVEQLRTWFEAATGEKKSAVYFGKELTNLGAERIHNGTQIRLTSEIPKARVWVIRNHKKWLNADLKAVQSHFVKHHASVSVLTETD